MIYPDRYIYFLSYTLRNIYLFIYLKSSEIYLRYINEQPWLGVGGVRSSILILVVCIVGASISIYLYIVYYMSTIY